MTDQMALELTVDTPESPYSEEETYLRQAAERLMMELFYPPSATAFESVYTALKEVLERQYQDDCALECSYCGSDKYAEPMWDEDEFAYFHTPKLGGKIIRCDATLLRMARSEKEK